MKEKEYDEMATKEYWERRMRRLKREAKEYIEYATSAAGKAEMQRREEIYQQWLGKGDQLIDQKTTQRVTQQINDAFANFFASLQEQEGKEGK